jgi:hypothetical protein
LTEEAVVERVARAICAARWLGRMEHLGLWDTLMESEREDYLRMARAAIEAYKNEQEKGLTHTTT